MTTNTKKCVHLLLDCPTKPVTLITSRYSNYVLTVSISNRIHFAYSYFGDKKKKKVGCFLWFFNSKKEDVPIFSPTWGIHHFYLTEALLPLLVWFLWIFGIYWSPSCEFQWALLKATRRHNNLSILARSIKSLYSRCRKKTVPQR